MTPSPTPKTRPPPCAWLPGNLWLVLLALVALFWLRDLWSWVVPALVLFGLWSVMAWRLAGQGGPLQRRC